MTLALSGKTNYLLTGRDASENKVTKAQETNVQVISEDDLLEMIRTRPGDKAPSTSQTRTTSKPVSTALKRKSSSTVSKTTNEVEPTTIPKSSSDDATLLCEYLISALVTHGVLHASQGSTSTNHSPSSSSSASRAIKLPCRNCWCGYAIGTSTTGAATKKYERSPPSASTAMKIQRCSKQPCSVVHPALVSRHLASDPFVVASCRQNHRRTAGLRTTTIRIRREERLGSTFEEVHAEHLQ